MKLTVNLRKMLFTVENFHKQETIQAKKFFFKNYKSSLEQEKQKINKMKVISLSRAHTDQQ